MSSVYEDNRLSHFLDTEARYSMTAGSGERQ